MSKCHIVRNHMSRLNYVQAVMAGGGRGVKRSHAYRLDMQRPR